MAEKMPTYWGTGRRKTSVARVRIRNGAGVVQVNARTIEDYFPRETSRMVVHQPFDVTHTEGTFDVTANVCGGGVSAQAEAVRLGIARALLEVNPELRSTLKKAGLLTRDARAVERKKYGRHKARKRPQYSKR